VQQKPDLDRDEEFESSATSCELCIYTPKTSPPDAKTGPQSPPRLDTRGRCTEMKIIFYPDSTKIGRRAAYQAAASPANTTRTSLETRTIASAPLDDGEGRPTGPTSLDRVFVNEVPIALAPLDDDCDALPTPAASAADSVPLAGTLELIRQMHHDPRPRSACNQIKLNSAKNTAITGFQWYLQAHDWGLEA
jgi:hypothetical protein